MMSLMISLQVLKSTMNQTICLKIIILSSLACIFLQDVKAAVPCPPTHFESLNGKCIQDKNFSDKFDDWDSSDENYCGKNILKVPGVCAAKKELTAWLLNRRNPISTADKWGSQVHRIAVALHLADESTFDPGNRTGDEIRYELTIKLLNYLKNDKKTNPQELALYIQALLVACMDPKDFYGKNLVSELRTRVEKTLNYTNPFQYLVLCQAGDFMKYNDNVRVNQIFDSYLRPSWADVQALSVMAITCMDIGTFLSKLDRLLMQLQYWLLGNFRTTALVTQALFTKNYYNHHSPSDFNQTIQIIIDGLKQKSIVHAYYALPIFTGKSLLSINSDHCRKEPITEEKAMMKALEVEGETIAVRYSVWIGNETEFSQIWELRVRVNSSVYEIIKTVAKIDSRQNVTFSWVSYKPYVTAVNEIEDDPQVDTYWSIYLRSTHSEEQPQFIKQSPMDVKLTSGQEIILWYKSSLWND